MYRTVILVFLAETKGYNSKSALATEDTYLLEPTTSSLLSRATNASTLLSPPSPLSEGESRATEILIANSGGTCEGE